MLPCDFSCVSDGICEPLCNEVSNMCELDVDCLGMALEEEQMEVRRLQSLIAAQFERGFAICFWTTCVVGIVCGVICFLACMNVNKEKVKRVEYWSMSSFPFDFTNSLRISKSSKQEEGLEEGGDDKLDEIVDDEDPENKVLASHEVDTTVPLEDQL